MKQKYFLISSIGPAVVQDMFRCDFCRQFKIYASFLYCVSEQEYFLLHDKDASYWDIFTGTSCLPKYIKLFFEQKSNAR